MIYDTRKTLVWAILMIATEKVPFTPIPIIRNLYLVLFSSSLMILRMRTAHSSVKLANILPEPRQNSNQAEILYRDPS